MHTEQNVKIAAKLYRCRDAAKSFAKMNKEDYVEMLKPYTHILNAVMKANKLEVMPALLKVSETNMYQDSGMAQLMFMAAVVEILEPSKPQNEENKI